MDGLIFLQPFLLSGKKKIAEVFHVTPDTVSDWVKDGAPIFLVGRLWQAEYSNLVRWLELVKPAKKSMAWESDDA